LSRFVLIFIMSSLLSASAGGLGSSSAGSRAAADQLTSARQTTVTTLYKNVSTFLQGCGQPDYDVRTTAVLFPLGKADEVYVSDSGIHAYFQVVHGRLLRKWCGGQGTTPLQTAHVTGANTFIAYIKAGTSGQLPQRYSLQQGTLPAYRGTLDLYSLTGVQSSQAVVTPVGKTTCLTPVKSGLGLNNPVIVKPLLCHR